MSMNAEQLRKAYYAVGGHGGPHNPYVCTCGDKFIVSDDRRVCKRNHQSKEKKP